jgi:hypothetical protein
LKSVFHLSPDVFSRTGILAAGQARGRFEDRRADVLGDAGIDGRFVDHDVAALERPADRLGGALQGAEIGLLAGVDRRRHRHDVEVGGAEILGIGGVAQAGRLEHFRFDFARAVMAAGEFGNAAGIDIEPQHLVADAAEAGGDGQADIAKPDDGDMPFHSIDS